MSLNENNNPDIQPLENVADINQTVEPKQSKAAENKAQKPKNNEETKSIKVELELKQTMKQRFLSTIALGLLFGLIAGLVFAGVQHLAGVNNDIVINNEQPNIIVRPNATNPATPTIPTNPTEPTEPSTQPTNPTEPTEPTEPTTPPTEPTEPTEPTTPPTEPTNPGGDILIGSTDIIETPNLEVIVTDVSTIVKNTMPSIVSITNLSVEEVHTVLAGKQQYEYQNSGSGVIIGENEREILIVTNNHVVEGNRVLTVVFSDGASVEALVKGTDSDYDISVVAVKKSDMSESTLNSIKIAVIGDSDNVVIGEPTIVIGDALGYGQSVTCGIVSALDRNVGGFSTPMLQTDAAINPGNSGGATLNIRGEVIGISAAKMIGNTVDNMGYAIPISDVKELIVEMMNRETREKVDRENRGLLGVTITNIDGNAEYYFNMPRGAYISKVDDGGAVDVAGISKGSIITKFDGYKINSIVGLTDLLAYYAAGETVELVIAVPNQYGEYDEQTVTVTLQAPVE